jgi:hypothetical protein
LVEVKGGRECRMNVLVITISMIIHHRQQSEDDHAPISSALIGQFPGHTPISSALIGQFPGHTPISSALIGQFPGHAPISSALIGQFPGHAPISFILVAGLLGFVCHEKKSYFSYLRYYTQWEEQAAVKHNALEAFKKLEAFLNYLGANQRPPLMPTIAQAMDLMEVRGRGRGGGGGRGREGEGWRRGREGGRERERKERGREGGGIGPVRKLCFINYSHERQGTTS